MAWSLKPITSLLVMIVMVACDVTAGEAELLSSAGLAAVNYLVIEEKVRPFQIVHEGRSEGGIISDIVEEIFRGTGITVNPVVFPVNRLRLSVRDGTITNWIAHDSPVWNSYGARGEMVEQPLFMTRHVLLTCSSRIQSPVTAIEELSGYSLAVLSHMDYLEVDRAAEEGLIRLVPVDRFQAGLTQVSMGRVDGFIEMVSKIRYHLRQFDGDKRCMREVDISAIIPDYPVHLSVDKRLPGEIKALVQRRLKEIADSGQLETILRRYVPTELPQEIQMKTAD